MASWVLSEWPGEGQEAGGGRAHGPRERGAEFLGPRPVVLDAQSQAASGGDYAGGGVEELVAQLLGFGQAQLPATAAPVTSSAR